MSEPSDIAIPEELSPRRPARQTAWRLAPPAPEPEPALDTDKAARRLGLLVAVGGAALFWAAVSAAVVLLRD